MTQVSIEEAKVRLSELVEAAIRGEEVVIAGNGETDVRLARIERALETDATVRPTLPVLDYTGCIDDLPEDASERVDEFLYSGTAK